MLEYLSSSAENSFKIKGRGERQSAGKFVIMINKALKFNFKVEASIQNPICRGKRYPRIYIGKNGRDQFLRLIKPHIIDCFQYKLPQL